MWQPFRKYTGKKPTQTQHDAKVSVTVHVDMAACIAKLMFGLALVGLTWSLSGDQAAAVLSAAFHAPESLFTLWGQQ